MKVVADVIFSITPENGSEIKDKVLTVVLSGIDQNTPKDIIRDQVIDFGKTQLMQMGYTHFVYKSHFIFHCILQPGDEDYEERIKQIPLNWPFTI